MGLKLSEAIARQRKTTSQKDSFDKLSMNYCQVTLLDFKSLPLKQYTNIKKLFLSHNHLFNLDGIELLKNLTHLSV